MTLLNKIKSDGISKFSRPKFYRLEKIGLFQGIPYHRTSGNHRSFSKKSAIDILVTMWMDLLGEESAKKYEQKLLKELKENKFFPHVKD